MINNRQRVMKALRSPAWIAFVWFGLTAGISLLATPVRFASGAMTRPVALDVSRIVFAALNKVELMALIILLVLVRMTGRAREMWVACGLLALILIAQSSWLLPELSARTEQILAGIEPASSFAHGAYSMMELSKLLILLFIGFRSMQLLIADGPVSQAKSGIDRLSGS
jgi:hypothetical protein